MVDAVATAGASFFERASGFLREVVERPVEQALDLGSPRLGLAGNDAQLRELDGVIWTGQDDGRPRPVVAAPKMLDLPHFLGLHALATPGV